MTRSTITALVLVGTATTFAVELRLWWLSRRGKRTWRWRIGGREYRARRK